MTRSSDCRRPPLTSVSRRLVAPKVGKNTIRFGAGMGYVSGLQRMIEKMLRGTRGHSEMAKEENLLHYAYVWRTLPLLVSTYVPLSTPKQKRKEQNSRPTAATAWRGRELSGH